MIATVNKLESQSVPVEPAQDAAARPMFVVGDMHSESSGVARIVCSLANALARRGCDVPVYTVKSGGREAAAYLLDHPEQCIAEPGRWTWRLSRSPALKHRLRRDVRDYDVIHSHSVWTLPNHYACLAGRRAKRPFMFTAHGTLEPWAMQRSGWKKRLVWRWFQRRDLRDAACIQVNSRREAEGVRRQGLSNPLPVIPNGVDLAPFADPHEDHLRNRFPELRGRRIALFLSRVHQKKGLDHLIEAWSRLAGAYGDTWRLVIVGPDDGHEAVARRAVAELGVAESVVFVGPLSGDEKAAALEHADLFALPSFSEGFSMAILEAMAARLPVLITPGCNFDAVAEREAGLIVSPDAHDTQRGLRTLMEMTDTERAEMGRRGRAMIERDYTWDRVAEQLAAVYNWLAGGGQRPSSVTWY